MRNNEPIGVDERELDDLALQALAEASASAPPGRLRAHLLETARAEALVRRIERSVRRWRMVGSVAATVVLVMSGLLARESGRTRAQSAALAELARTNATLVARLDDQGKTLVGLREALDSQGQMLRVLSGPRTLSASLGPKEGFGGSGRVLVDAETGEAHVVLAGLPQPAAGKIYELWAIRGDRPPEPAGLIAVSAGPATAARVARIPAPSEVAAFAISIEPAGGSQSPTGPIVLVGKVT